MCNTEKGQANNVTTQGKPVTFLISANKQLKTPTVSLLDCISYFGKHSLSLCWVSHSTDMTTDACEADCCHSLHIAITSCIKVAAIAVLQGGETRKVSYYILGGNIRALLHDGSNCKPQTVGYMYLKLQFFRVIYTRMRIQPFVRAQP